MYQKVPTDMHFAQREKEIAAFLRKHLKNSIFRMTRRNPLIEVQVMDV